MCSGEESIFRITLIVPGIVPAAQGEGPTEHDSSNQLLERPAIVYQLQCQMVEQFWMTGSFARATEVIDGTHQAPAHQVMPDAIGLNSRGQPTRSTVGMSQPKS